MKNQGKHQKQCAICGKMIEAGRTVCLSETANRERKVKRRNGVYAVPDDESIGSYKLKFDHEERYDVYAAQTRIWSVSLCELCAEKIKKMVEIMKAQSSVEGEIYEENKD